MSFKIVTWNINSARVRLPHLIDLIENEKPDIICLQEIKCENKNFPEKILSDLSFNCYINGQKTYNGVAILSKFNADEVKVNFPNNPVPDQSRFVEIAFQSPIGYSRVISLYAPNGTEVNSDKFDIKLKFYDSFTKYINSIKCFEEKLFIAGDYNIAPFDVDVYSPEKLKNSLCFTDEEQEKLRVILNSGFVDNFRIKYPEKEEFSWWDYRLGSFPRNKGLRIDTIISTANATSHLLDCFIDKNTRSKSKPSDHAPVIANYG